MPLPVSLHHTCFVVRDLEATAQRLADSLGIGPWNIWTITPAVLRVRGKDAPASFRIALATVGGGTYELIAPHQGHSLYVDDLATRGEGFHHTCLFYSSIEDVEAAKTELLRQGREMIQEGGSGDAFAFAYFSFPEIGSPIEVLYIDVSKLPPPERVIQPKV